MFDLKLFLPGFLGFSASYLCPIREDVGVSIPLRPPAYVFAPVWTILYALIGYGFSQTKDNLVKSLFGIQIFLLTLWPITFSKYCFNDQKSSIYIIALIIGITIGIIALHKKRSVVIAMLPLVSWLMIAFSLNNFVLLG